MNIHLKILVALLLIGNQVFSATKNFQNLEILPSFSLGAPGGLVSGYGSAFIIGVGITNDDETDGGLAVGMGYGNPDSLGGTISLGIGSIDPRDGGAGNRGCLNFSVGHNFNDYLTGVSLGVSEIDLWHDNETEYEEDPSFYLVATKLFPNEIAPIIISLGFGNNNFAKISEEDEDKKDKVYPFASLAAYVMPQVSLILDYTSDITSVGIGLVPFSKFPVSFSFGAYDVTKEREQDKISFMGTVAIGFRL